MSNTAFNPLVVGSSGGQSSAETLLKTITVSNTFATNDVVYYNGSAWAKATADTVANAQAIGIVQSASGSDFVVVYGGFYTGTGITAGAIHYLDPSTAGLLTTTKPEIAVPILYGLSSTTGIVLHNEPNAIQGGYVVAGGTSNALTATIAPAYKAYVSGMYIWIKGASANTLGTATINVNGLGDKNIYYKGSATIPAGAIQSGGVSLLVYDGTQFNLLTNLGTVTSVAVSADNGVEVVSGSPITASGTIALRGKLGYREVSGTTDTILNTDRAKLINYTSASSDVAVALPEANASSEFLDEWFCVVQNFGFAEVTITPVTSLIDGVAAIVLPPKKSITIVSSGGNYYTFGNGGIFEIVVRRLASNSTVSNTTATDIGNLNFHAIAGNTYEFQFVGAMASSGASGRRFRITFPTGTMLAAMVGSNSNTEEHHDVITASGTNTLEKYCVYNTSSLPDGQFLISGTFVCTVSGTVQLQQLNAAAGAYNSIVWAGSYVRYQQIA